MAPILVPELPGRTRSPSEHLRETLSTTPHLFLQPTRSLYTTSLSYLKATLDPIAQSVSAVQTERLVRSRKRKRGTRRHGSGRTNAGNSSSGSSDDEDDDTVAEPLRIKAVHVQDFEVEQVWDQVRRVLDAARLETEGDIKRLKRQVEELDDLDGEPELDDGVEVDGQDSSLEESLSEDEDDELLDDPDALDDFDDEDGLEVDDEDENEDVQDAEQDDNEAQGEYQPDPNGLNDGFFFIDDFNKRSALLEQADARGDPAGSDSEEEIDFTADPMTAGQAEQTDGGKHKKPKSGERDTNDGSDDDGPTFGDMDLDAPEGESDDDDIGLDMADAADDDDDLGNTNQVMYKDFFAPPPQKARKNKKGRPNPHNFPVKTPQTTTTSSNDKPDLMDDDADQQRTMDAVHRDLFEDDSEPEDDDDLDAQDQPDPSNPASRKSTHERRQLALAAEIRKLEAANVAKRDWTLSGEARAADRPVNSLLQENLDFERTGKPMTVVTAELSESLEELIKRRILAHEFQDLIRRRPDDLATGNSNSRRGLRDFELSEQKDKKSLAELYEDDHLKATDANYTDAASEKTTKAEAEIQTLWRALCANLDSLSSWNFRPRAPVPQLDVRVDAPAISLEDARPAGVEAGSTAGRLAPQEVYRAGDGVERALGETVTRGGGVVAREEMSRDEKRRRRRRDKERIAKKNGNQGVGAGAGKAVDEQGNEKSAKKNKEREMLGQLKRGGVRVIGKKGEMRDVEGNKVSAQTGGTAVRASALKL